MGLYGNLMDVTMDKAMFRPLFFRLDIDEDWNKYKEITNTVSGINISDSIDSQLRELIKCRYPAKKLQEDDYTALIAELLNGKTLQQYGVWVYYPWSRNMVHLLDKEEFIEVRTNRNKYKITGREQDILSTKKIGIIGLSVGQSIALTLAMERGCGELRLADFDTLDLSNINRIRSGVQNIGQKKVVIAAREIAEIDPYLDIICYDQGITEQNIDAFLLDGGKLDLLVDECDSLDIKLLARIKARDNGIPVLMDTSDRGMLDVERFDLEPQRPLLHGLADGLDPQKVAVLSPEEKIPIVLKLTSAGNGSMRGKASMLEIGMTISTWPQLASSVVLGGAVAADVSRRLLLGIFNGSGRFYVDIEEIVGGKEKGAQSIERPNPYEPLALNAIKKIIENQYFERGSATVALDNEQLEEVLKAAMAAPSTGNDQPWKWYYHDGMLFLFHDRFRSFSFGDFNNIASYLTFGAVLENLVLEAHKAGLEVSIDKLPLGESSELIAVVRFSKVADDDTEKHVHDELADLIYVRSTNRNPGPRKEIEPAVLQDLKSVAETVSGAELSWLTQPVDILEAGKIIAACDRMRFMHPEGHYDFVHREMRWRPEDAEATKDGIDIYTLGLSKPQIAAMQILKEYDVIDFVRQQKGGKLMEMATIGTVIPSSAIGLITMPRVSAEQYITGGRSYERMWLAAEKHGLALHPLISPLYFFPRITQDIENNSLSTENIVELKMLRERFKQLFRIREGLAEVFLFKLACVPKAGPMALRKPVNEMLFTD
ncbi:MAG: hypothetical protein BGO69_02735 [Bacteroidetes bacterium 46-16]|nr:MAG: hypothetical protein BGO69_02735 [Bacteroidetes bacterium 46-16]